MRILILEDEPIVAIDLEDIVTTRLVGADCEIASTVLNGLRCVEAGVDFALLDVHLGIDRADCLAVAAALTARSIPFCFVTGNRRSVPARYRSVPFVSKPFQPFQIEDVLPQRASV